MSWSEYIDLVEKANSYRNRVKPKRLKSDMGKYGVGTAKGSKKAQRGSPYKNVKVSFKGKGFNDISAPLEEAEEESFVLHDELQPDIWKADELDNEVQSRLMEIATDFMDGLEIPVEVVDVRLTGSLANYNWSRYSDIDVHILVDFSKINADTKLVKAFFDEARMRWNDKHRIMIHDFEVEIYVEDTDEDHKSSGLYSLMEQGWLNKPSPDSRDIDFMTAQKKSEDFVCRTQGIAKLVADEKFEQALKRIERTKEKIRDMRKVGLESEEAEFSPENIAFKILRRDDVLSQLNDLKQIAYDKLMSIKEE
jgi:RNase H-fold protein (predicted Holliday junction resolvase)